jgi:hypothetical protein
MSHVDNLTPPTIDQFLNAAIPEVMGAIEKNHREFEEIHEKSEAAFSADNDPEVERLSRLYVDETPLHLRNQDTLTLLKKLAVQVAACQHIDMRDDIKRTKRDLTDLNIVDPEAVETAFKLELGQSRAV